MAKTRIRKANMKQGIDGCEFELALTGKDMKDLQEQPLINQQGRKYGSVRAYNGKATIGLCLPKFVRGNNIEPFTLTDCIKLEIIKNDCESQLRLLFGNNLNTEITKIEVNITQKVSGQASQHDVMNLLCHATLSDKFDNVKYVGKNKQDLESLKENSHGVLTRHPHYWIGKFYDKTEQQIKERIEHNLPFDDVPDGLFRIEFVLIDRTLKRIFGKKRTLSDILTKKNLTEVMREYKRIFCDELVDGMIKPYLTACDMKLRESLTETDNPIMTIAKYRELIPDKRVLHRALSKYQKIRGKADNSARDTKRYAEKYDLPSDVILTISDFKKACG